MSTQSDEYEEEGWSGSGSGSGDYGDDEVPYVKSYLIPLCILAGIIVLVNSCILMLVWRNTKLRSNCNALLVSLAIADGTTGLVGIPLYVLSHFSADLMSLRKECFMILGQQTWIWFVAIVSIFHLLIIACEQYLAILKPFSHDKIVTKKTTALALAIIWMIALLHSHIPWLWILPVGYNFCDIYDATRERNDKIYVVFSILVFFCLPIAVLHFVYLRIVFEAKRQLGRIRRDSVSYKGRNLSSCTRYRGFYIIALMWIVFLLCWSPYFAYVLYETFKGHVESQLAVKVLTVLRFLPSLFNPIMFAFWRSDFRSACIERFCCCVLTHDHTRSSFTSGKQIPLINRLSDSKDCKPQNV